MTRVCLWLGDNPPFHHLELLNFVWNKEPACVQKKKGTSAGNSLTNSRTNVWLFFFFLSVLMHACVRVCLWFIFLQAASSCFSSLFYFLVFIFLITTLKSSPVGTPLSLLLFPPSPPPPLPHPLSPTQMNFSVYWWHFGILREAFWCLTDLFLDGNLFIQRDRGDTHRKRERKTKRRNHFLWIWSLDDCAGVVRADVSEGRVGVKGECVFVLRSRLWSHISHRRWWRFLSVFFFFCLFNVFVPFLFVWWLRHKKTKQKTFPGDFDCATLRQICTKGGWEGRGNGVMEKKKPSWLGDKSKVLWCQNGKNVSPAETIKHTPLL